jgi:Rap1a immunity proteins
LVTIIFCSFLWFPVPLFAQGVVDIWDGRKLYELCSSANAGSSLLAAWQSGQCHGYVLAVADQLNGKAFCIPSDVAERELRKIVVDHIAAHSEDQAKGATELIAEALLAMFPCR